MSYGANKYIQAYKVNAKAKLIVKGLTLLSLPILCIRTNLTEGSGMT